jgi:3,4-dihydroxy 2-butanone 4-phosphate synthase/GTP cyclohydrolase II
MSWMARSPFVTVEAAIAEIRSGGMVVVCDDGSCATRGDLVIAAQFATAEALNFMAKHARGLICLTLTPGRCRALGLQPMARAGSGTEFMVSIEARKGVSTGISTADRARTIAVAVNPATSEEDIVQPGHVFPVRTRPGGVLERSDIAEASVDLARLAGLRPAAVKCEVLNEDGTTAELPELVAYGARRRLKLLRVDDLISFRLRHDQYVERLSSRRIDTRHGPIDGVAYRSLVAGGYQVAFVKGNVVGRRDVRLRVADAAEPLDVAFETIFRHPRGIVLYFLDGEQGESAVRRLGSSDDGIALHELLAGAAFGRPASARDYAIGAQVVIDLGVSSTRIVTNDPKASFAMVSHLVLLNHHVSIQRLAGSPAGTSSRSPLARRAPLLHEASVIPTGSPS